MRVVGRGRVWFGATLVAAAASILLGASMASAAPARLAPGDGEWLFTQEASRATLKGVGHDRFRLTLIRPNSQVQAFTDRPARQFELVSLAGFVSSWRSYGFQRVRPNAAIERQRGGRRQDVLVVELSKPKLDRGGNLSYLARPLRGQRPSDLRSFNARADRKLPTRLGPVTLFIDDANDSRVEFTLSFHVTTAQWAGSVGLSAPVLVSANIPSGAIYRQQGSALLVQFTNGGDGTMTWTTDALGGCVYVTTETFFGDVALTGQVAGGPQTAVTPTTPGVSVKTGVPVTTQSTCRQ
jgi:hypothetical protein